LKSDAFLSSAKPADWPVDASWQALVRHFFENTCGRQLSKFIDERLKAGAHIYPPQPLRALQFTPLTEVRVVILGQDPYTAWDRRKAWRFQCSQALHRRLLCAISSKS
jgi:uracil DNA glycosylase